MTRHKKNMSLGVNTLNRASNTMPRNNSDGSSPSSPKSLFGAVHRHMSVGNIIEVTLELKELYRDSQVSTVYTYSFLIKVTCRSRPPPTMGHQDDQVFSWVIRRNCEDLRRLDWLLHEKRCYAVDRMVSQSMTLHKPSVVALSSYSQLCSHYSNYLSHLNDKLLSTERAKGNLNIFARCYCNLVLDWLEMSCEGTHERVRQVPIGSQAERMKYVGRVHRRYSSQALGDMSVDVGDLLNITSYIDSSASAWCFGTCQRPNVKVASSGFVPIACVDLAYVYDKKTPCRIPEMLPDDDSYSYTTITEDKSPTEGPDGKKETRRSRRNNGATQETRVIKRPIFGKTLKIVLDVERDVLQSKVCPCPKIGEYTTSTFCDDTSYSVPFIVRRMLEYVHEHGIVNGIYRLSGSMTEMNAMRENFDRSDFTFDLEVYDTHSISSTIKLYFRDLSDPLIPCQHYQTLIDTIQDYGEASPMPGARSMAPSSRPPVKAPAVTSTRFNVENCLRQIHEIIQGFPCVHYHTLKLVVLHLQFMVQHVTKTNMNLYNLAIMWAPNILFAPGEKGRELSMTELVQATERASKKGKLLEVMIKYADDLFMDRVPLTILKEIDALKGREMNRRLLCDEEIEKPEVQTASSPKLSTIEVSVSSTSLDSTPRKRSVGILERFFNKGESKKPVLAHRKASLVEPPTSGGLTRDETFDSGTYASICTTSTPHPFQTGTLATFNGENSEMGSEDSIIAEDVPMVEVIDPNDHEYSCVDRCSKDYRRNPAFVDRNVTQDETFAYSGGTSTFSSSYHSNTTSPNHGMEETNFQLIDSTPTSPLVEPKSSCSTPFSQRSQLQTRSKDSSIDLIEKDLEPSPPQSIRSKNKSPPFVIRRPSHDLSYNFQANQTLDNYHSDVAYPKNQIYQRYFKSPAKSNAFAPKSNSTLSSSRTPLKTAENRENVRKKSPEWATCSIDSGLENNASESTSTDNLI